jgi:hypothetical protein
MRRPVLLAACAAAVAFAAHAQQPPSLNWPTLAQCQNPNHPTLPPIWSGTYLLQPYLQPEAQSPGISVMELTVDTTVPAMLMTVAGSEMEGAYLVQGETTYSIVYDMQGNPVGCGSIGDTGLRVLSQDLLSNAAVCAGSLPILGTGADWWKMPAVRPPPNDPMVSNWIWYRQSD